MRLQYAMVEWVLFLVYGICRCGKTSNMQNVISASRQAWLSLDNIWFRLFHFRSVCSICVNCQSFNCEPNRLYCLKSVFRCRPAKKGQKKKDTHYNRYKYKCFMILVNANEKPSKTGLFSFYFSMCLNSTAHVTIESFCRGC